MEIIRSTFQRGNFRAVLFDFDGTLSLIRRNWQDVMIPMMADVLQETGTSESRESLLRQVEEFVMRLNGKQTIYQMMQLQEEVLARGGKPQDPLDYKNRYHDLLWEQVGARVAGLKAGTVPIEEYTVPGSHDLLQAFTKRGLQLYLASGTDLKYVRDEVRTLQFDDYFGEHVYGALDDYRNFSKEMIVRKIVQEIGVKGEELIGFGDGYVEIQEIRKVGGLAIGVASEEEKRSGINEWKRERLIKAGADIIIGDYRSLGELMGVLGLA